MSPLFAVIILLIAAAAAFLFHHRGKRTRLYRELAKKRRSLIARKALVIQTDVDPAALQPGFEQTRIARIENFLSPESLAELRAECSANRGRAERSYVPGHKKGGTLSYENIHRLAPACLAFYHSPALRQWLSDLIGEQVYPTADHDQSSCSILYYNREGDHIGWHYDHNFYKGRHFTVLLSVVNRGREGGLSRARLLQQHSDGKTVEWDTGENVLVVFEGARIRHQATALGPDEERIMLSMTLSTEPLVDPMKELVRRIKDTAFYGPRALID